MSKSEDGHYELVLGNRQLVSGFFVLIILFAIFLTLGYVLGLNSVVVADPQESNNRVAVEDPGPRAPIRSAMAENAKPSASGTLVSESASEASAASQPSPNADASPTQGQTSTVPALGANTGNAVGAAPAPTQPTPTSTVKPAVATSATVAANPAPPAKTPVTEAQKILDSRVRVITPRKGDTFVQVAAIGRAEAELMAGNLQRRGYRTFITEVPGKELFRVLVGPFETPAKLTETKAKLAAEGIESIVQRY
ncbi:MAG: SPOR domain-containing protein [Bryobacterales bacterium]|jgi:cell division protein FtsN|nr:SPOR domain-containing protein [Bryobacterales bacterium]